MINLKVTGLTRVFNDLNKAGKQATNMMFDEAVKQAAIPIVNQLKQNYAAHSVTGALVESIMAFQRKKNGKGPYYAYYIGPRYTGGGTKGSKAVVRYGGNAAHLLEYGTEERYRANKAGGGVAIRGKVGRKYITRMYGAKISTGKVAPLGIIRRTKDEMESKTIKNLEINVTRALDKIFEKYGLNN